MIEPTQLPISSDSEPEPIEIDDASEAVGCVIVTDDDFHFDDLGHQFEACP